MKIAVTVWDDKIAPVFDSARTLLIVDIKNERINTISYHPFDPKFTARLTEELNHLGIDVFICGAISEIHSTLIEACRIQLISFMSGNVTQILEAFAKGNPLAPSFLMPGCNGENASFL